MVSKSFLAVAALAVAAAAAPPSVHVDASAKKPGSPASIKNMKDKIKNVVVVVMENRSFDNLMGGQTIPGLDNPIQTGPYCNPVNISEPQKGSACSQALDYDSVSNDPNHSVSGNNLEFYGTYNPDNGAIAEGSLKPGMKGFVTEQRSLYAADANDTTLETQVMHYYTEGQVPVITALSQNFHVFNRWHSDVPGPTNPNRVALCSGTTNGAGANNFGDNTMPQRSIFQQVSELGMEWKDYISPAAHADVLWFSWTTETNNTDRVVPLDDFYTDAAAGTLPQFSYINPSCCGVGTTSMHPSGRVSDGQQFLKEIYEALRASPQWNETMWIVTFDESGGFHDHVHPPKVVKPDGVTYTELTPDGKNYTLHFNRLGGRLPTWIVSPWIAAGVEQQGLNSAGKTVSYHATSILRTLGYLWDFDAFNPRVENAPSFDHLVGTTFREDAPITLPNVVNFTSF